MEKGGFFYNCNLDNRLQGEIQGYQDERQQMWEESSPEDQVFFDQSERFAFLIQKTSKHFYQSGQIEYDDFGSLQYEYAKLSAKNKKTRKSEIEEKIDSICNSVISESEKIKQLREILNEHWDDEPEEPACESSRLKLVWERLCIDHAWALVSEIPDCADRTIKLYELAIKIKAPKEVLAFLFRLSRCYIYGFDPECVMLCRSVIDTAFREIIPNDVGLAKRIVAAHKEKVIDRNTRETAFSIKDRGDKAVHYQPDITTNVLDTIQKTIFVLEKLYDNKEERGI